MFQIILNLGVIVSLLRRIERKLDDTMATVSEALNEILAKVNKIFDEQAPALEAAQAKIAQLEAALANRELTPEEASAIEEVKTALNKVDNLIPDAPIEAPAETPAEAPVEGQ